MNETIRILLIVCPLIFLSGLIDSVAGGGGLISLPAYLAAGLPPHLAAGTNKCSATFGTLVSTLRFMKNRRVHYLSAVVSAAAALAGSSLGAMLNMGADERVLQVLLVAALPVIAVFLLIKRDFGAESRIERLSKRALVALSLAIGFVLGLYDGFFGPGTGTFLILAYTGIVGFDLVTASGNAKIVNLPSTVAALVTYALGRKSLFRLGIPAARFGIAGNWIGSGLALKRGAKIIRPMFFVALGILLCKVLWDLFF